MQTYFTTTGRDSQKLPDPGGISLSERAHRPKTGASRGGDGENRRRFPQDLGGTGAWFGGSARMAGREAVDLPAAVWYHRPAAAARQNEREGRYSTVKKVIVGSAMFLTGILSAVILLAGAMAFQFEHINLSPFAMTMQILTTYGLTPVLYAAVGIAVVGAVIAILGLKEK